MPALVGGFGNYLVPVQIGAPDCTKHIIRWTSYLVSPSKFGHYLAGLWEGDGHIWIPKTTHAPSGKRYTPHFAITFAACDYPLVCMLKLMIGGNIRHKVDDNAYVLTITSIDSLLYLIKLINGKLRTPKLGQFNKLISWINSDTQSTIATFEADKSDILSNAWLSGFIDADGSFDIRVSLISNGAAKDRVSVRMRLEQRMNDPHTNESYLGIMTLIAKGLGVRLYSFLIFDQKLTHNGGVKYFSIAASSESARAIIVNYFSVFPLFSSRRLNYLDWLTCHKMMVDGQHTTNFGRSEAMRLKSGMNSKRTHFNWEHLDILKNY